MHFYKQSFASVFKNEIYLTTSSNSFGCSGWSFCNVLCLVTNASPFLLIGAYEISPYR